MLVGIVLWVARRTDGTVGGTGFGYARGQGGVMFEFASVCVVETLTMSVLLRDHPLAHRIVLVLDVYTVLFVVGLHAASVVRPHVLGPDSLRIRHGGHVDLLVPLERIAGVRRELRTTHQPTEGELDVPVSSQTTLTLELAEPVPHFTFLGRRRDVHLVRFHADDAEALVHRIRQVRNVPSPFPGRPG
ncbi:hypothetical protein [Streptomyces sp. NPDC006668]|uniref:hypothetical protein n=1 Tax=Streptomyces sp. NPDC006668 TaxID=3156903 RepID=UPI00340DF9AA